MVCNEAGSTNNIPLSKRRVGVVRDWQEIVGAKIALGAMRKQHVVKQ